MRDGESMGREGKVIITTKFQERGCKSHTVFIEYLTGSFVFIYMKSLKCVEEGRFRVHFQSRNVLRIFMFIQNMLGISCFVPITLVI
jgi:hypothetical protein